MFITIFGEGTIQKKSTKEKLPHAVLKVKITQSRENRIEAALKTGGYKHLHTRFASKKTYIL